MCITTRDLFLSTVFFSPLLSVELVAMLVTRLGLAAGLEAGCFGSWFCSNICHLGSLRHFTFTQDWLEILQHQQEPPTSFFRNCI